MLPGFSLQTRSEPITVGNLRADAEPIRIECVFEVSNMSFSVFFKSRFIARCCSGKERGDNNVMKDEKEKATNRVPMVVNDTELELFMDAMKRDGMSQLTTWMKSILSRYANGRLVPTSLATSLATSDEPVSKLLLKALAEHDGKLPLGMSISDIKPD